MVNVECPASNGIRATLVERTGSAFPEVPRTKLRSFAQVPLRYPTLGVLLLLLSLPLFANELQVDKHTLAVDDSLTITITLTDAFASIDNVQVPLQNLVIDGSPSVSSEFSWINGQSTRRKVLRYSAHPRGAGPALIGPLVLRSSDGEVETLPPVAIQVLPDRSSGTNDPVRILHELLATDRDPIFIVAEADKTDVFVGEQINVTWTVYNATNVQQHGIGDFPKFADFWTEELDVRSETLQQAVVAGVPMQKLVVRRVALFPLRSGTLQVEPMAIDAQILKRADSSSPFGLFEGTMVDVHRRSAALTIEARPIPPGPAVAAVGDVAIRCFPPVQRNGGPVSTDVELTGRANLRGAPPPAFARPPEGNVQVAEKGVSVERKGESRMTRRWKFLLFPSRTGMFAIPALTTSILTPEGSRRELRCEERTLRVEAADDSAAPPPPLDPARAAGPDGKGWLLVAGFALLALVVFVLAWPRIVRVRRTRRALRGLIRATPAETRVVVDEWLVSHEIDPAGLVRELSDRGDAYRSVRSLLEAAERERFITGEAEIRRRLRELVATLGSPERRDPTR